MERSFEKLPPGLGSGQIEADILFEDLGLHGIEGAAVALESGSDAVLEAEFCFVGLLNQSAEAAAKSPGYAIDAQLVEFSVLLCNLVLHSLGHSRFEQFEPVEETGLGLDDQIRGS